MNDQVEAPDDEDEEDYQKPELSAELAPVMAQIEAIKALQTSGINFFLFTEIHTQEQADEARALVDKIEEEIERQEEDMSAVRLPDELDQLVTYLENALDDWDDSWENESNVDEDDSDDDLKPS